MTNPLPVLHLDRPARYRLRLQGRVSANWADWLSDPVAAFEAGGPAAVTILTGTVQDQASLFGLLSFIRDLAVPLIALELISSNS
jgi:hypothetical protein